VETVREADGLAMSSRNRFLSSGERDVAPAVIEVLRTTAAGLQAGGQAGELLANGRTTLTQKGFDVGYLALVQGDTLAPIDRLSPGARLILAAKLGTVRLLDNIRAD
jgi:pantoate--beta-alanine ligase